MGGGMGGAREKLFDSWAESYDESVSEPSGFPHEGYEQVLDLVAERAQVTGGMEVLDLGIGTGNLAGRMLERGCTVWGLDFSLRMLAKVHERYPSIELIKADLRGDWPLDVDRRFDRIVSAYVLHELDLESKIRLLDKLVCDHLVDGGRVVVGAISFPTRKLREEAHRRAAGRWDEDEYYWAADETLDALAGIALAVDYEQVSFCGGVYTLTTEGASCDE
jgi:putative AdoMet-dependent methyltransferase